MHRHILSINLLACATLLSAHTPADTAQFRADSIPQPSYPILTPLSSIQEVDDLIGQLQFQKVSTLIAERTKKAKRKRESTAELDLLQDFCHKGEVGLRGVDLVAVVDSVVVSKEDFLKAYPITQDLGKLTLSDNGEAVSYRTQLNGNLLRPEYDDGVFKLFRYYSEGEKLSERTLVQGLGVDGDINYPFLMPNGQTLYFAARDEEGSGNYDLYVTRYDSENRTFYQAENMGYPYNSSANDYMLVIDESLGLGWFATDRYQPDGKVCVYTFIPNAARHPIDFEATRTDQLRAAASLRPISSIPLTPEQKVAVASAKRRLLAPATHSGRGVAGDFEFVVNDSKVCRTLSDFSSKEARDVCGKWLVCRREYEDTLQELDKSRLNPAGHEERIRTLERDLVSLRKQLNDLAKQTRRAELE